MRGCSRPSSCYAASGRSSSSCSPATTGPAPPGVRLSGRVEPDELARLYRTAAALVFPSLYEGFGQPPLEAMACGCPVACSNAASLPEVCGDAARMFDPTSPEAIAEGVDEVLRAPEEWRRRGLERARQFTWESTARAHDDVRTALGRREMAVCTPSTKRHPARRLSRRARQLTAEPL